ncbi:MAG TPA: MauE/DoxX family redox-associated membrane protein [Bacteroidia bacterium]|jgi:copper chaperone CopZ
MTHTYNVTGMTCTGCEAKVKHLISKVDGVQSVDIDLTTGDTKITMSKHIDTATLKTALKDHPKYQLTEKEAPKHKFEPINFEEDQKSWLETYKPILLIFGYITGITLLAQLTNESFLWMEWMNHFMAGFFLVFSFFKILNLTGFAESYAMYDIVAKRWNGYGYLYAFIELALGIAYLTGFNPVVTNAVTLIVMSVSIVGVLQSVMDNKKIKCACLGAVFNLPMSTITIIEDALMIGMSALMLIKMM